jgi:hypothetical protein
MLERNKKWKRENPQKALAVARRSRLKRVYGITPEEYDAMAAMQENACAICESECATGYRLAVDHEHETGRIRGLLCMHCNAGIGNLRDSVPRLQAAIRYLSRPV